MNLCIDPRTNKPKIILDCCGGTGSWSKPYREAGYNVQVITLPDNDVRLYAPPANVYGILAAPPCEHFSVMRCNTAKIPRDVDGSLQVVMGCLRIIFACKPKFWALENPRGMLRRYLGRPPWSFQPFEFGDQASKKTDIWGYYNIPKKKPVELLPETLARQRKHHIHIFPAAKEYPGVSRAGRRAITPPGFARAFYEANK